jgi:hypothetical protein
MYDEILIKPEPLTKCIVHSGLVVDLGITALIELRQICRFDYFTGGKFGSLRNLNIIALNSATKPYISRSTPFKERPTIQ